MSDAIIRATAEHCWQEEQLAHAEWFYARTAAQRAELGGDQRNPWRAVMRTSLVRVIEQLEAAGHYSNAPLHGPGAHARKPAIHQYSPYDYEVGQRVECMFAEKQWKRRGEIIGG